MCLKNTSNAVKKKESIGPGLFLFQLKAEDVKNKWSQGAIIKLERQHNWGEIMVMCLFTF